ncbi:MAG: glutamine-hydrolyzing carbamoyl-phosphate synthase small subunit [Chitinophagales bacterium]|nr:glutamine-hydrolyzing carbamoyl-phosphate synthase small subunit [Chitinophagales bacterium]
MELTNLNQEAVLLLEDGTVFRGKQCGNAGIKVGEINFVVGMTGFQEIFTDPSNCGQILVTTNTHVGNYGVAPNESASNKVQIAGLVCNKFANNYSRVQAEKGLQELFEENDVVGVEDIDTRALVRHIRSKGSMLGILSSNGEKIDELKRQLKDYPKNNTTDLLKNVSTPQAYTVGEETAKFKIAVLDLGVRKNILDNLVWHDAYVKVFPYNTSLEEINKFQPQAYLIPNGPGNPNDLREVIRMIQTILKTDKPLLGLGLGCQLMAISQNVEVVKMNHGHRSDNQPVKNLMTGKAETTIQSYSYTINREQAEKSTLIQITHVNLNDEVVEGISIKNKKAFGVQFLPIIYTKEHDSAYIYDQFFELIK